VVYHFAGVNLEFLTLLNTSFSITSCEVALSKDHVMKRTLLVSLALTFVTLYISVIPAYAHDPLFLSSAQSDPKAGPYLPDGTISFAIYGEFLAEGETRGFQVNFQEGDFFQLDLLIPALVPEENLMDDQLPFIEVVDPNGTKETLLPSIRTRFDEPFTNTSYYTLIRKQGSAMSGIYDITIVARHSARFTAAIGTREQFGTPVERAGNQPSTFSETEQRIEEWYGEAGSALSEGSPLQEEDGENPQSHNRVIWFFVLIGLAAGPVILIIRRLRSSNSKEEE